MAYILFGGFKILGALFAIFFATKPFKGCPVKFFAKMFARGNSVQILSNFPAKRLSEKFGSHLKLSDFYLF